MEAMYFSAFVLGMCALHLTFRTSGQMEAWWRKHGTRSAAKNSGTKQRSDWYVFFHCADLLGDEKRETRATRKNVAGEISGRPTRRSPRTGARLTK